MPNFNIVTGAWQGDTFVSYLIIICLIKENGFTLKKTRSKWYLAETMTDADYIDDLILLANTLAQTKSLQHSLKQAIGSIDLYVKANETEFTCFKQEGAISTLCGKPLKLVDQFTYLGSNISSTENDVIICIGKAWTTVDRLLIIWKSDLSDKIKWDFFQAVVVSVLLYRCTTKTLMKCTEKKPNRNYSRMLHAILNKSWKQHLTKQQLYNFSSHKTSKTYRESKDKFMSDVLLWIPSYGPTSVGWLSRTYIYHLCTDPEDLPGVMDGRDRWQKRLKELHAISTTLWLHSLKLS